MAVINRGFGGRRGAAHSRLPPGQTLVSDWPVLTAGLTPDIGAHEWTFTITTETGTEHGWDWNTLQKVGVENIVTDIHCVTHWSKLGTTWRGVAVDTLLQGIETSAEYVVEFADGGYTTNVPLDDLRDGRAWVAYEFDGEPLESEHGGPARMLVPHLYFWKSAKWVRGLTLSDDDRPGFWEQNGYHNYGDPWREQRYWND